MHELSLTSTEILGLLNRLDLSLEQLKHIALCLECNITGCRCCASTCKDIPAVNNSWT